MVTTIFSRLLKLAKEYPSIHESFLQSEFIVRLRCNKCKEMLRNTSAIPMDQVIESKHNKPAKHASEIIYYTKYTPAKDTSEITNYTNLLRQMSRINNKDKYSLHHEFSKERTETNL